MDCAILPGIRYFVWALNSSHRMTLCELKQHLEKNRTRTILICHYVLDQTGAVRKMSNTELQCLPLDNPQIRVTSEKENPDQRNYEIMLGNFRSRERTYYRYPGWTTVREGKDAYSATGKKLPAEFFPVFVAMEEIFPGSTIHSNHMVA